MILIQKPTHLLVRTVKIMTSVISLTNMGRLSGNCAISHGPKYSISVPCCSSCQEGWLLTLFRLRWKCVEIEWECIGQVYRIVRHHRGDHHCECGLFHLLNRLKTAPLKLRAAANFLIRTLPLRSYNS